MAACNCDAMVNPQYPFQGSASTDPSGVWANHLFTSGFDCWERRLTFMNDCPYCGASLPDSAASFCPECGTVLPGEKKSDRQPDTQACKPLQKKTVCRRTARPTNQSKKLPRIKPRQRMTGMTGTMTISSLWMKAGSGRGLTKQSSRKRRSCWAALRLPSESASPYRWQRCFIYPRELLRRIRRRTRYRCCAAASVFAFQRQKRAYG